MNKFDDFVWVKKVIDSCTTLVQKVRCRRLVRAFEKKYPNEWELYEELSDYLTYKRIEV